MKNIKFNIENAAKINALLGEVNGRASDHTYRSFNHFSVDADAVIWKIENLLGGKKYCLGAKFSIESGGSVKSAYKYTRIGTRLSLECRASGWFVTDIQRADIWARGGECKIVLTQAHHDQAVKVLRNGYQIAA
jgi:hypothetical protein